jgi:uncharacterized membrane protein (UPF0127 family)
VKAGREPAQAVTLTHNRQRLVEWRIRLALSWSHRAIGLLTTAHLDDPRGLWISPCNSVHTLGMRYAIDVVFLDKQGRAKKLVRRLKPMRAVICFGAHSALELRVGAIDDLSIQPGDQICLSA